MIIIIHYMKFVPEKQACVNCLGF